MSLTTSEQRSGRLPAETTSFIGRRDELTEIGRLFERCRLVTLMGPGGVGKTRLAIRAASQLGASFDDGVSFVDLSGLRESGLLAQAVGSTFGLPDQAPEAALDALVNYLSGRRLLLVLDTCEHLVDGCAMLAEVLLQNSPGLRVLVTSRQPLDISGEYTLVVSPLAVPDGALGDAFAGPLMPVQGSPPPSFVPPGEGLGEVRRLLAEPCDSMTLFAERASAVVSGWSLTAENFQLVALLCHRLDGIPLAIELTAVQLRALSIQQVVARLDRRMLRLSGRRSSMSRHQTLRAAIDWSHELCEPGERLLWARLSVFAGDFDLEDAEQVCGDDELPAEDIMDLLAGLVAQSIVLRVDADGAARYRMLDSLREYGAERLEERGETELLQKRMFDRFCRAIRVAWAELGTQAQPGWLEWFRRGQTNLRVSMEYGLRLASDLDLLTMILGFGRILALQGLISEARHWGNRVLETRDPHRVRDRAATEAFALVALLAILQEDLVAGREYMAEAERRIQADGDDVKGLGYVRLAQGTAALFTNQTDDAVKLLREADDLHRLAGNEDVLVPVTGLLLTATFALTLKIKDAKKQATKVVAATESTGEQWCLSYALCLRGLALALGGDHRRGQPDLRAGVRIKRDLDDRLGLALAFDMAGLIKFGLKDYEGASRMAGAAAATLRFTGVSLFGPRHRDLRDLYMGQAKKLMGEEPFQKAYDSGSGLSLEVAVGEVLGEPVVPPQASAPIEDGLKGDAPLTRRELEIAGLVTQGLTNREIAARLVIAKRTVDSHVEHILSKLSFSSRAQIAVWYSQRR